MRFDHTFHRRRAVTTCYDILDALDTGDYRRAVDLSARLHNTIKRLRGAQHT